MGLNALHFVFCVCFICVVSQKLTFTPSFNKLEIENTKDASTKSSSKYSSIKTSTVAYSTPKNSQISLANKYEYSDPSRNQNEKIIDLVCPGKEVRIPFFSLPCRTAKDCTVLGNSKFVCCSGRCIKGVLAPKEEIKHAPTWFGLVNRKCAAEPLAEIFEIKECKTDADCAPRICCPERLNGSDKSYCRIAEPILDKVPLVKQIFEPFRTIASYMQCTPPPPPFLDLFPKPCKNALDCFPNLCCQERGQKFCRPPKRSILALAAGVGQRIVPSQIAKRFIERLN